MKDKKSKTILIVGIILFALLAIGAVCGYAYYLKEIKVYPEEQVIDKKSEEEKAQKEKELKEKIKNNKVYGYLALKDGEKSRIVELNSNIEDKVIKEVNGGIYSFRILHNKLYYYYQYDNEVASYIDLSSKDKKNVDMISGPEVVDYYFDSNDKYLFSSALISLFIPSTIGVTFVSIQLRTLSVIF